MAWPVKRGNPPPATGVTGPATHHASTVTRVCRTRKRGQTSLDQIWQLSTDQAEVWKELPSYPFYTVKQIPPSLFKTLLLDLSRMSTFGLPRVRRGPIWLQLFQPTAGDNSFKLLVNKLRIQVFSLSCLIVCTQNLKIFLCQETTARKMTLSVAAETEAPDLHDLVTKKDPDGFVWDHQFTVSYHE